MLGRRIDDPLGVESSREPAVAGLGLLDVDDAASRPRRRGTVYRVAGQTRDGLPVIGYEIHMGETTRGAAVAAPGSP